MPGSPRKPTGGTRPPSLRGALVIDTTRGSPRVRAWPAPRGQNRHPTNIFWTNWLKWATHLYNYQPAPLKAELASMTAGTPWMPRDVFISAMRGRAFLIVLPNGRKYYPMPAREDVSQTIDTLAQIPGQMLFRGRHLWLPIQPGAYGDALTFIDADTPPEWTPVPPPAVVVMPILMETAIAPTWPINSTSYVTAARQLIPVPFDVFPFTQYRLMIDGVSTQAGQTISAITIATDAPTESLSHTDPELVMTSSPGFHDTGWLDVTRTLDGTPHVGLALKGSNSTVDFSPTRIVYWLRL